MSYSQNELIEAVQDLAERLGHAPSVNDLREDDDTPSRDPFERVFGSWNKALDAAGLDRRQDYQIDEENLLEALVRLARDLGRVPSETDMDEQGQFSSAPYRSHWPDWQSALHAAGMERDRPRDRPSDRELVDHLRAVANYDHKGRTARLSKRDLPDDGYAYATYLRRFGSWQDALAAAGLPFPKHGYSRERIIDEIKAVAETVGKSPGGSGSAPTFDEFLEHGDISISPVRREFDTWNNAVAEAGYMPNEGGRPEGLNEYSSGELLQALRDVADELNEPPTYGEFDDRGEINPKTLAARFGSWSRALRLVGKQPQEKRDSASARDTVSSPAGTINDPVIEEIVVDQDGVPTRIQLGDLILDDRTNFAYSILGIACEPAAAKPQWKIVGELLEYEGPFFRTFWGDELRDRLNDHLFVISGE